MSQDQEQQSKYSSPTSGGGLILRVLVAGLALAGVVGVIWYMTK